MNKKEKQAYLSKIHARYNEAGKLTRSAILDEFCTVCNYNRKYAIRLLKTPRKQSDPVLEIRTPFYATDPTFSNSAGII